FAALTSSLVSSYATAIEPSTRTRGAIATKNANRAAVRASARDLARIVQAFPATTDTQRIALGLTVRDGTVAPINPPTVPPVLEVVSTIGRTIKVRLHGTGTDRRRK